MGLETGSPGYIADLIATNPLTTDSKQQGDDHLRFIKTVLKNTFPNATKPFTFPDAATKTASYTILASESSRLFMVDTTAAAISITLPTLTGNDAGWWCQMMKYSGGLNPIFIYPPSGSLLTGSLGVAFTRRNIPYSPFRIFWTGGLWVVDRVPHVPVGTVLEYQGGPLPVGYEWPNGQTLPPTLYPEFAQIRGSGLTQDRRGRYAPMADQGTGRLGNSGLAGTISTGAQDGVGGEFYHYVTAGEMPSHRHTAALSDPGHSHTMNGGNPTLTVGYPVGQCAFSGGQPQCSTTSITIDSDPTNIRIYSSDGGYDTTYLAGGGAPMNLLPPTIVCNFILVVE